MLNSKTFTFLNLAGFAVGFAVCLVIAIFIYREYSVDKNFPNYQNIYRIVDANKNAVGIDRDIIPQLQNSFPEIKMITPIYYSNEWEETIQNADNGDFIKVKDILVSDNSFFKMAGLKTIASLSATPFQDHNTMVLSKSTALKLFGNTNVLNKSVKMLGNTYVVSAVVDDLPDNSSLAADLYIHQATTTNNFWSVNNKEKGWYFIRDLYLTLAENTNIQDFTARLNTNFPANKTNVEKVKLQPLASIYFDKPLKSSNNKSANKPVLWIVSSIALLILLMSVFNYTNYNISQQMQTFKTTGIKITYGASFKQIHHYYITDVAVFVSIAFLLALLLAYSLLPNASYLLGVKLFFSSILHPKLLLTVVSLLLFVIVISAFSPVLFISRLNMQTLFGKSKLTTNKSPIKRVMTTVQLTASIILLASIFMMTKQLQMVRTADVGFNKEHLLRVNIDYKFKQHQALKTAFQQLPFVKSVSLSCHAPGMGWEYYNVKNKSGDNVKMYVIYADKDFLQTFGIDLLQGREFRESDLDKSVYFTKKAFATMGYDNLEDCKFMKDQVVGIVNDINTFSLHTETLPIFIKYRTRFINDISIKLSKGDLHEQMKILKQTWQSIATNEPFAFQFYDQVFDAMYKKEVKQVKILSLFGVIAFIITCMGLLSQILQTTQNRTKEIGIRKINGASIKEVMLLLNKEFIWTVVTAFIIATPIAYYSMTKWLENFAYKTALSWWIFALAGLSALAIALLTVSWQSWRAANKNPVEALRYE